MVEPIVGGSRAVAPTINNRVETTAVYYAKPGRQNTQQTLSLALRRAQELGIRTILVATSRGETGVQAVEAFPGYKVVVVTHAAGHKEPNLQEVTSEQRSLIEEKGGTVLTTTHAFAGVNRAIRRKFNTYQVSEIMAWTLRVFGHGVKVCCEISLMAADAGAVRTDEEVIAIAGTSRGADTAVVLQPAHAQDFFDLKVKEIICKPRL
ncbi:MAG: hypothetical protein HYY01_03240 [Chloroflexi bacterium]|nr:hypothetical protein [Chloroflexota bacterium]